jgi:4-hydroxyphenylpyruvate dioxygenase-like putative hemolysin
LLKHNHTYISYPPFYIMISGIAHINLTIPEDTLEQAEEFYGTTLGLTSAPVPELQKGTILW